MRFIRLPGKVARAAVYFTQVTWYEVESAAALPASTSSLAAWCVPAPVESEVQVGVAPPPRLTEPQPELCSAEVIAPEEKKVRSSTSVGRRQPVEPLMVAVAQ